MDGSRFGSSDRLTGLSVTVSNTLRTTTTLSGGSVVSGRVVAAAFLVGTESSGNVAISSGAESEKDIIPSASLHIFAKRSNHVPLWVQTTVNAVLVNSLFVSPNTDVGIGTSVPTSRLSVRSQSASDASLHLASFSGASVLAVKFRADGFFFRRSHDRHHAAIGAIHNATSVYNAVSRAY
jgi:hypothetical protein